MKLKIIAEASDVVREWTPKTALPEGQHVIADVDGYVQCTYTSVGSEGVDYAIWDQTQELWVVAYGEHEGRTFSDLIIAPQEDQ